MKLTRIAELLTTLVLAVTPVAAQEAIAPAKGESATTTNTAPARTLPQRHECQRQLRAFMATLTEKDFDHGVTGLLDAKAPFDNDPEYLYRTYIYTHMRQPLVGSKDNPSPPTL